MSIWIVVFSVVSILSWAIFYDEERREKFGLSYLVLLLVSCASLAYFAADQGAGLERFTREAIDQQRQKLKAEAALEARKSLAKIDRRLQAGLKRLKCYDGIVDGNWGEQSSEALNRLIVAVGLETMYPDGAKIPIVEIEKMLATARIKDCKRPERPVEKPITASSKTTAPDWKRKIFSDH